MLHHIAPLDCSAISAEIAARRAVFGMDADAVASACRHRTLLDAIVGPLTADHYARYRASPHFHRNVGPVQAALEKETVRHLRELFTRGFEGGYLESLARMHEMEAAAGHGARNRLAIALRLFVGGFSRIGAPFPVVGPLIARRCASLAQLLLIDVLNAVGIEQAVLTAHGEGDRRQLDQAVSGLTRDIADGLAAIRQASAELDVVSDATRSAAQSTLDEAAASRSGTRNANATIAATAAAATEMASSIAEIDRASAQSLDAARKAEAIALEAERALGSLADKVASIGSIVDMIAAIAGQTNMLALNATIEAARAGPAGKGFAVVAQEVKSLSEQTARATHDIDRQIATIRDGMRVSMASIADVSRTIADATLLSGTIAETISEQRKATAEIDAVTQSAVAHTEEVVVSLERVMETAARTQDVSGDMMALSHGLMEEAERLSRRVQAFADALKAG